MPNLGTYERQLGARNLRKVTPVARQSTATPAFDGLAKVADVAGEIAGRIETAKATRETATAELGYRRDMDEMLRNLKADGDADHNEFESRFEKESLTIREKHQKALTSKTARETFELRGPVLEENYRFKVRDLRDQRAVAVEKAELLGMLDSFQEQANTLDVDSETLADSRAAALSQIEIMKANGFYDEEQATRLMMQVDDANQKGNSLRLQVAVDALIDGGNFVEAQAAFDEGKVDIPKEDVAKLDIAFKAKIKGRDAFQTADNYYDSEGSYGEAMTKARADISDPDKLVMVEKRIMDRAQIDAKERALVEDDANRAALEHVFAGGDINSMPASVMSKASPSWLLTLSKQKDVSKSAGYVDAKQSENLRLGFDVMLKGNPEFALEEAEDWPDYLQEEFNMMTEKDRMELMVDIADTRRTLLEEKTKAASSEGVDKYLDELVDGVQLYAPSFKLSKKYDFSDKKVTERERDLRKHLLAKAREWSVVGEGKPIPENLREKWVAEAFEAQTNGRYSVRSDLQWQPDPTIDFEINRARQKETPVYE